MDEKSIKRRSWIKNIAIIFLALMLVLTFFSNTISNLSTPEVAVQYASPGTITTRVRGSGTVFADQSFEVKLPDTRVISDIGVKVGARVEEGDVLFRLEEEAPDLTDKKERLEELKFSYQKSLLTLPTDFSSYQQAISTAQYNLNRAREKNGAVAAVDSDAVSAELERLKEEKNYLESKNAAVLAAASDSSLSSKTYLYFDTSDDDLVAKLTDAETEADLRKAERYDADDAVMRDEALVEQATAAADEAQALYDKVIADSGADVDDSVLKSMYRTLQDLETSLDQLKVTQDRNLADLASEMGKAQKAYNEAEAAWRADPENQELKSAFDMAYTSLYDSSLTYSRALEDAQTALEAKELEITRYREDIREKEVEIVESGEASVSVKAAKDALDEKKAALEAAQKTQTADEKALEKAEKAESEANDAVLLIRYVQNSRAIRELDVKIEDCKEQLASAESPVDEETIHSLETALTQAQASYKLAMDQYTVEQKLTALEMEKAKKEIDDLQAEIDALESSVSETEITAAYAGTVSSVNVRIGDKAAMNSVLCVIELVDRGCSMSFTVTAEQAKRIRVGDVATPQYYWGSSELTARVSAVTADSPSATERTVTVHIDGGVSVGDNLTVVLGERSASYDIVVPRSALHEDSNGAYVLTVQSKSTPLGTRYTARRANVNVIAQDDENAAVSGELGSYEYVIITSASPIDDGMQVRLKES